MKNESPSMQQSTPPMTIEQWREIEQELVGKIRALKSTKCDLLNARIQSKLDWQTNSTFVPLDQRLQMDLNINKAIAELQEAKQQLAIHMQARPKLQPPIASENSDKGTLHFDPEMKLEELDSGALVRAFVRLCKASDQQWIITGAKSIVTSATESHV